MITTVANILIGGTGKNNEIGAHYENHYIQFWKNQGKTIVPRYVVAIGFFGEVYEVTGLIATLDPNNILPSDLIALPCPPFCPDEEQVLLKDIIA